MVDFDEPTRSTEGELSITYENADGWTNFSTGMGTPRDKLTAAMYLPSFELGYEELKNLYYGDDMCERIVDELPDDALGRGFKLEGPDAAEALEKLSAVEGEGRFYKGLWLSRLFGGAGLIIGVDDNSPELPLDVTKVQQVRFLNAVDRRYIIPETYYTDGLSPKCGEPQTYTVTPAFGENIAVARVHESRVVRFNGTKIDPITSRELAGWSYSVLQRPFDILRLFASSFQAAGQLMVDAGQAIIQVKSLIAQLGSDKRTAILQRLTALDQQRWAGRMLPLDLDNESFHREPVNLSGADKMLEHFEMRLAAAAKMPVAKLMGRAPAGLDATGESDTNMWNRQIKAYRKYVEPHLTYLLDVLTAGKWKKDPKNKIAWPELDEPSDKEKADVEESRARRWKILSVDVGAISGEQVALVEFGKVPIEEVFDEEAIAALEDIVEADRKLALNPPDPPPAVTPPAADPNAPPIPPGNGAPRGSQPAPGGAQAPPNAGRK